jgi:hypothetical protein
MHGSLLIRIGSQVWQPGEHLLEHDLFQLAGDEMAGAEVQSVPEGSMALPRMVKVEDIRIGVRPQREGSAWARPSSSVYSRRYFRSRDGGPGVSSSSA